MDIIRKARKDHTCDFCLRSIASGEEYLIITNRVGKYDDNDKQIGIEFIKFKSHINDPGDVPCHAPEDCRKGDHIDYVFVTGYNGCESSGHEEGYYCHDCGHFLTIEQYENENQV